MHNLIFKDNSAIAMFFLFQTTRDASHIALRDSIRTKTIQLKLNSCTEF